MFESQGIYKMEDVEAIAETDRAILVNAGSEELWIPKTQVHDDSEVWHKGDMGRLVITEWIATKLGII